MTTAEFALLARRRIERLFDALVDPVRCERTMMLLLTGYVATWSLYAAIAKSSQDIHADMGEMVAWSREVGLGTPKHPPLAAWLVRIWFSVFPREDWAYYLFAMILPTVALWITWRLSARYLPRDKRVVGIALLTFVPFYNFHALKFNANTVLTPFWAATTWWFLCSYETRRAGWAVLAGVGAAAAMLGKYWSVIMLAGLGFAALTGSRRDAYFSSPAPYLTLAVGTILLTPHVDWIVAHQFVSFNYAMAAHQTTFLTAIYSAFSFVVSSFGYVLAPIVFCLLAAQPDVTAIKDMVWPLESDRRTIVIVFASPFLFAALIAVILRVQLEPLWAISAMTLFPVVLLSSPLVVVTRSAALRLLALAIAFPLIMVAASPMIAIIFHRQGAVEYESQYRLVAQAVERAWRAHTDKPLRIVASYDSVANGTTFYFESQPSTFDIDNPAQTPWINDARIRREGIAIVCPEAKVICTRAISFFPAYYRAYEAESVVIARSYLGTEDTAVRYEIVIIPPQAQ
jgi:4-amino-4-deoxy-L-arabinose transferase-like glycosyltransferase